MFTNPTLVIGVAGLDWSTLTNEAIERLGAQGSSFTDPLGGPPPNPRYVLQAISEQSEGARLFADMATDAETFQQVLQATVGEGAIPFMERPVLVVGGLVTPDLVRAFDEGVRWVVGEDAQYVLLVTQTTADTFDMPDVLSDVVVVDDDLSDLDRRLCELVGTPLAPGSTGFP